MAGKSKRPSEDRSSRPMPVWRSSQQRAHEGAEEYKAMGASLLRLSRSLSEAYDVRCRPIPDENERPVSADSIKQCFLAHEQRRSLAFLARSRASGRRWRSVQEFVGDAKAPSEAVMRRNYLRLLGWHAFKGQMLEALCLLAALSRYGFAGQRVSIDVFGQNGPIPVRWAGRDVFLWTQARLPLSRSGLRAQPDLLCSRSERVGARLDIEWIVEAKCHGDLTSQILRAEFGKAFDLESPAYTIVAHKKPRQSLLRAAEAFGIDIQVFPLSSEDRPEYLSGARLLEQDLADGLVSSRDSQRFGQRILSKGRELKHKLLSGSA
jgi:hypothetical protein